MKKHDHLRIGVLETNWETKKNTSVRPLFDVLSDINTGGVHGYVYERFSSKRAFSDAMEYLIANRSVNYLYIAAHGGRQDGANLESLCASNGDRISRREIRFDICSKTTLHGLYLGSCEFGTTKNAQFLLQDAPNKKHPRSPYKNHLRWIATYHKRVDWIESSALDYLFWHKLFWRAEHQPGKKIQAVACDLLSECSGLIRQLGFHLFCRSKGPSGGIHDLVASAHE